MSAAKPTINDEIAAQEGVPSPIFEPPPPAFTAPPRSAPPPRTAATDWTSSPATLGNAPTWHAGGAAAPASLAEPDTAEQQLDLARAYLDMGDDDAARAVLRSVLDSRDPAARDTAARMLRDL
jgi:pilus assembly protein FimV